MVRSWLVAFTDDPRVPRAWWDLLFCRPGFRHVEAWGWDRDAERWVIYSVFTRETCLTVLPDGEVANAVIGGICAVSSHVLRYEPPATPERGPTLRLGMWCAPAVAHLLGVRSLRALVPFGLYLDLLRRGAELLYEADRGWITERADPGPGGGGSESPGAGAG